ncbi:MAG: hypothetical protein HRT47_01130 [Candidatus Caenarcaniphilales bacterium]|nr:hypothetical protein [Candidatus Caenarcaniphilales bacterium]
MSLESLSNLTTAQAPTTKTENKEGVQNSEKNPVDAISSLGATSTGDPKIDGLMKMIFQFLGGFLGDNGEKTEKANTEGLKPDPETFIDRDGNVIPLSERSDEQLKESGDEILTKELAEQFKLLGEDPESKDVDKDLMAKIIAVQSDRNGLSETEVSESIDSLLEEASITGEEATEIKAELTQGIKKFNEGEVDQFGKDGETTKAEEDRTVSTKEFDAKESLPSTTAWEQKEAVLV